jgi:hypothetical protein
MTKSASNRRDGLPILVQGATGAGGRQAQVADRRGSEWDACVDSQSAFVTPDIGPESVNTSCATSVDVQTTLQNLNAKATHAEDFMS